MKLNSASSPPLLQRRRESRQHYIIEQQDVRRQPRLFLFRKKVICWDTLSLGEGRGEARTAGAITAFRLFAFLIFNFSFLIAGGQTWLTNTGAKIYVGPGGMYVKGGVSHDSASVIHTYGSLRADTIKNEGDIDLKGDSSLLIIDSALLLESGKVELNNRTLIINNRDTAALRVTDGKLITDDDSAGGNVQWHIGQYAGRYIVPFTNDSLEEVTMELNVTQPGYGLEGYVDFHTYKTNNNNEPLPYDTSSDAARMLIESPLEITDRYWSLTPVNYATDPFAEINVSYTTTDTSGSNTIVHDSLILSRWDNNCWMQIPGAIDSQIRAYKSDTVSQYGLYVLHDKNIPLLCNDGHDCGYSLFYAGRDNDLTLYDMGEDTVIWLKFRAEEDSTNLFRVSNNDTTTLNLKKIEVFAQCTDTACFYSVTIGNGTPIKYFTVSGLIPGNTYHMKFHKKVSGSSLFRVDSPDLRLFASTATECTDSSEADEVCLWFSDFSGVYPCETPNKYFWKVYTLDSNELVHVDTTITDTARISATLDFDEYYYKLEERDAKNILLKTWEMPTYMNTSFKTEEETPVVYEDELYDDESFDEEIDLQKPVGTIVGFHGSTPTGAGTYTIPIPVPPGTNGMVPNLSLVYNSQAGNGIMGMGWSISGLSVISRMGGDWYHGQNTYPVNLDDNDRFALDGNRLINTSGTYGATGTIYGTEFETFSKITSIGQFVTGVTNNPFAFSVETKDGMNMTYGGSTSNNTFLLASDNSHVLLWRINNIMDKYGNYIEFKYENSNNESRILEINYTGNFTEGQAPYNKVKFEYVSGRIDKNTVFIAGSPVSSKYLLSKIIITTEGSDFKTFEFIYGKDGINTYLKKIIEKGADNASLNATRFKYYDPPQDFNSFPSTIGINESIDIFPGDFNGDGFSDLLVANYEIHNSGVPVKHHTGYKVLINTGFGSSFDEVVDCTLDWDIVGTSPGVPNGYYNFLTSDFNGDGYDDYLTINTIFETDFDGGGDDGEEDDVWRLEGIFLHLGDSDPEFSLNYNPINIFDPDHESDDFDPRKNYFFTGDFDGDGKKDVIIITQDGAHIVFPFKHGHGSAGRLWRSPDGYYNLAWEIRDANKVLVIDFNGDGKDELMVLRDDGSDLCDIYSFRGTVTNIIATFGYPTKWHQIFIGDFNGDRKTDILTRNDDDHWHVGYGDGKGYTSIRFYPDPLPDFHSVTQVLQDKITLADYNGDGKTDILHGHTDSEDKKLIVYYSRGASFSREEYSYDSFYGGNIDYPFVPSDLNGDGRAEILNRYSLIYGTDKLYFKAEGREQLLQKVTNGIGQTVEYQHQPLTSPYTISTGNQFYTKSAIYTPYPLNNVEMAIYAVKSIKVPDGVGGDILTEFAYEDARIHRAGRGFLGFKKIIAVNNATQLKSVSEFEVSNTYYASTLKDITTSLISNSSPISQINNSNGFIQVGNATTEGTRFYSRVNSSSEKDHLTGVWKTILFTYDSDGNITEEYYEIDHASASSPFQSSTTQIHYGTYGTPVPAKPTYVWNSVKQRTDLFTYDSKGSLLSKTEYSGKPCQVTTTYSYNDFGNIETEVVYATGLTSRTVKYDYDTKERFPTHVYRTFNSQDQLQSVTTYDHRWGKPTSITGINGVVTEFDYDEWGRLEEETQKEGTAEEHVINTSYEWDVQSTPFPSLYFVYTEWADIGMPNCTVWYDIYERETQRQTEGFNGDLLTQGTSYIPRGNVSAETNEYYSTESPVTTSYGYDVYGRLNSSAITMGSNYTTTYNFSYSGGNVTHTVTNPASQVSWSKTNALGQVIEAHDNGGTLAYEYDSYGNQTKVKAGSLTLVTNVFDACCRQEQLIDKNAGTTSYRYNTFGELVWQKDANSNEHTMTYDELGRITSRVGPEGTTSYEYWTTGGGINQIKKITGFNGNNEEYFYDQFGRVIQEKRNVLLSTWYEYNKFDQLKYVTYPDLYAIERVYDDYGYLSEIKDNAQPSVTIFTADDYNGFGQCLEYTLGNGQTTTREFEYGFPTNFSTPNIKDIYFDWNYSTGNLSERSENRSHSTLLIESFTYDNLNRLKTWQLDANPAMSLTYSTTAGFSNGNIASKTDAGNYAYHPTKINAVASVTNSQSNISTETQGITYTAFHQPNEITEKVGNDNYKETFVYGPDYQRVSSILTKNAANPRLRVYFDDYESHVDQNGFSGELHYIGSPAGLVCIVVKTGGEYYYYYTYTDHLGSILAVTDDAGDIVAEQNFDPWGRKRDPDTWEYTNVPSVPAWLFRGFTGHEHMPLFGLVNMNGRMYDPILGRMLSTDNYVQDPLSTQGFNRYGYVMNNPLKYTDPNGEWFGYDDLITFALSAVVGYVSYGISTGSWGKDALVVAGISGVAGWLSYNTAGATTSLFASLGIEQMGAAAIGQGVGGMVGSATGTTLSQLYFNKSVDPGLLFQSSMYGFGSGIASGTFDASPFYEKHFPMNHTAKYIIRSTYSETLGILASGGDFSDMTYGFNAGIILPFASDITSVTSPLWASKKTKKIINNGMETVNKEDIHISSTIKQRTTIDYGYYSKYDHFVYLEGDNYLYNEVGVVAKIAPRGGFSVDRVGGIQPKGIGLRDVSGLYINYPVVSLPFNRQTSMHLASAYVNAYRYWRH